MQDKYIVAKYLRISLEDGDCPESDSIGNQRELLDLHISVIFKSIPNLEVIELIDDGYTGTNMNRPAMQKLLVLAETHQIHCVIVKDFSRFARDYIDVGRYTDMIFPEWQIRFISTNDAYDSTDYLGATCGIDVAMKNLSNTMYSLDLSEKIKSVKHLQQKQGKFISCFAIYGYVKSPEDKHKLIVDPEAAEVVKRIFNMRDDGISFRRIAAILNNEGIPSPSEYKKKFLTVDKDWTGRKKKAFWIESGVARIVADERYTGKMVSGQTAKSYVGGKKIYTDRNTYIKVENTHEAIISQEQYDRLKPKPFVRRKSENSKPRLLLSGLIRCGGCQCLLVPYGTFPLHVKYQCHLTAVGANDNCCKERYYEEELNNAVLTIVKNELKRASELANVQRKFNAKLKMQEHKIQLIHKEISGLKQQKVDGYIRLTKRQLTEAEFFELKNKIERQIAVCEAKLQGYTENPMPEEDRKALNLFERFIDAKEYTNEMLKALIKNIYVYDDKRIKIEWNFTERLVENDICKEKEESA